MILADTSIWIDHLRGGDDALARQLEAGAVLMHPFVLGEIACGSLKRRAHTLSLLRALPMAAVAEFDEVLGFIEHHRLHGKGIGFVDQHLLAATALGDGARLWTRDRRLHGIAAALGLAQGQAAPIN